MTSDMEQHPGTKTSEVTGLRPDAQVRPYAPGDESEITSMLNASFADKWGSQELWRWKHSGRPGFEPEDVMVISIQGRMGASFHSAILPIRLEEGLEVPMCVEGDFAILQEFRSMGLALPAHDLASRRLLASGVILRGGFTSLELNAKFYHRQFGYIFAPTISTDFRKILGLGPLEDKVRRLGDRLLGVRRIRNALRGEAFCVDLTIDGLPPCHLEVTDQAVTLRPGCALRPDVHLTFPYLLLAAARSGGPLRFARALVLQGLTGRIRVGGWVGSANRWGQLAVRLVRGQ